MVLLGYNISTGENLFWLLFDYPDHQFFKGNKRKISLGNALNNSQTEGVTFRDQYTGYVVSENFSVLPQKLLRFNIQQFLDNTVSTYEHLNLNHQLTVYPNPFSNQFFINSHIPISKIILTDFNGQLVTLLATSSNEYSYEISADYLASGMYLLTIVTHQGTLHRKIWKP